MVTPPSRCPLGHIWRRSVAHCGERVVELRSIGSLHRRATERASDGLPAQATLLSFSSPRRTSRGLWLREPCGLRQL